ncbi:MAG: ATP-binding protein [Candidatus Magasanikbacteria bacterium]
MSKELYNNPDLKTLVKREESSNFEKKSAKVHQRKLAKEFSAIANSSVEGGLVVVGIKDDSKVEGFNEVGESRANKVKQSANEYCQEAKVNWREMEVKNEKGEDDKIILFYVSYSRDRVIELTDGTAYERIGDQTHKLSPEKKRLMKQDKGQSRFEKEIEPQVSLEDLNKDELNKFKEKWASRDSLDSTPSPQETLLHRGLGKESKEGVDVTNAAMLLFYDNPEEFIPGAKIRFIRYEGNEVRTGENSNIIKDEQFTGPLPQQIEQASAMIKNQIKEFSFLDEESGKFTTKLEYPRFAWKETIVNAVAHRAYNLKNEFIFIRMFDDRLEVQSPGNLPNVVTLNNIYKKTYARNPLIMQSLLCLGYVKNASEGMDRIKDEMVNMGLPEPELNNDKEAINFTITLYNDIENRTQKEEAEKIGEIEQEVISGLGPDERLIIEFLTRNDEGSTSDFTKEIGKSRQTVIRKLNGLLNEGIVDRIGEKGPNVKYTLNSEIFEKEDLSSPAKNSNNSNDEDKQQSFL